MTGQVRLRETTRDDLPTFFEQQVDPDANHMAGFTVCGHYRGFANARGEEIDEVILKLGRKD